MGCGGLCHKRKLAKCVVVGCGATTGTSGNCEQAVAGYGELWQARINGVEFGARQVREREGRHSEKLRRHSEKLR